MQRLGLLSHAWKRDAMFAQSGVFAVMFLGDKVVVTSYTHPIHGLRITSRVE